MGFFSQTTRDGSSRKARPQHEGTEMRERCDRCGAAAATEAMMPSGNVLYLCGHHAKKHKKGLIAAGALIVQKEEVKL